MERKRLPELFSERNNLLSIYYTAGFPTLDQTIQLARSLEQAGADFIEIGFPFSDPVADGPIIQESSMRAIKNGMSLKTLFAQLEALRPAVTIPVILMGYLNPVLQFGVEKFLEQASSCGVDGIILPDLPIEEYKSTLQPLFKKYQLHNIFLATPQTSDVRLKQIDELTTSFVYLLSSSATTGKSNAKGDVIRRWETRLFSLKLKSPVMIGFGIDSNRSFNEACSVASGAIVGTAFIKSLMNGVQVNDFVNAIRYSG